MILHKYYEIMKQFTGNYEKEIYGRELVDKIEISQKGIALALEELEKKSILKSRKKGNLKFYSLNRDNPETRDFILITEIFSKLAFLKKHPKLAHLLNSEKRIVGIFGSYAKGKQKEDSDIDLFIIGNKQTNDYNEKGRTFDLDISIKYFNEKEFVSLMKEKNTLIDEIVQNHILISNCEGFINLVWGDNN